MKNFSILALAVALAGAGLATMPVLAAASMNTVPMCTSLTPQTNLKNDIETLKLSHAGQDIASVDVWNGCLKVIYNGANGHSTTAFYDPDTLSLVGGAGPGKEG